METLTTPKSYSEANQWYGTIDAGGPAIPEMTEIEEFGAQPVFIHPAEKPLSSADAISRFKQYEQHY